MREKLDQVGPPSKDQRKCILRITIVGVAGLACGVNL